MFLYDVTSSYLEGVQNVLAAFGYNRDGKRGKKQLVIVLLSGPDGIPVVVRVFEGNTPDTGTVAEQVRILASNFGVKAITVVGDRGMLKQTEIGLLNEERFHYITAITKPQIKKLIREGAFQLDMFEEKLCEVEVDGVRYILRRNAERAKEVARNREGKLNGVRKLLNRENLYLAEHRGARIEVARRGVEEKARQLEIDAWAKVVSKERILELVIDDAVRAVT